MTMQPPPPAPIPVVPAATVTPIVKPTIAIINETTVLTDAEAAKAVPSFQKQVSGDFAPLWGRDANLVFVPRGGKVPPGAWQQALLDNADQAGALGYHDKTADGHPLGKIFVKTTQTYGGNWTVTASHELLEMLGDPDIVRCVFLQTAEEAGTLYAYEACDAVEDDSLGYTIDGIVVSDFVTQEWFDPGHYNTVFSFKRNVKSPLVLADGGYIGYFKVGRGSGWQQLTARGLPPKAHQLALPGSRRERRARGHHNWSHSTAHAGE
jgi:hypothetical protein